MPTDIAELCRQLDGVECDIDDCQSALGVKRTERAVLLRAIMLAELPEKDVLTDLHLSGGAAAFHVTGGAA